MPPFSTPKIVISGLKERFESLTIQGEAHRAAVVFMINLAFAADRLYLGSSTGNLHIYGLSEVYDPAIDAEVYSHP